MTTKYWRKPRRDYAIGLAPVAGVAVVAIAVATSARKEPTVRSPIRLGMVGIGNWVQQGNVRVVDLLPELDLSALYSRRGDNTAAAAAIFGFRHVAGWQG
jgi:hypothetical protein